MSSYVTQTEAKDLVEMPTPCGFTLAIVRDSTAVYRQPLIERFGFVK